MIKNISVLNGFNFRFFSNSEKVSNDRSLSEYELLKKTYMDLSHKRSSSEEEELYKTYIHLSSEAIYRIEFEGGMGIDQSLSEREQIEFFFEKSILAECNDAMAKIFGFKSREELTGTKIKELLIKFSPGNIESIKAFFRSGYKLTDAHSVEKDNQGNIKYFLNNLIGICKKGKLLRVWGTQRDITDVKMAEDTLIKMNNELTKKNSQLVKMNNELDSLIYTVSHDLNAPLSNIEGLVNILKMDPCYNNVDTKQFIDLMDVAVLRFKDTIKDIAAIPKSQLIQEEGSEAVTFSEILDNVIFSISNLITDTGAEIKTNFDCEKININRTSLQSVFFNLLSNSIKYRHPDRRPYIEVSAWEQNDIVILEVKDNGIGFSPERSTDVFDLFKRLHGHVEGSGLGLYIVKRIAENGGGKVEVRSIPGEGSDFKVYFKKNGHI